MTFYSHVFITILAITKNTLIKFFCSKQEKSLNWPNLLLSKLEKVSWVQSLFITSIKLGGSHNIFIEKQNQLLEKDNIAVLYYCSIHFLQSYNKYLYLSIESILIGAWYIYTARKESKLHLWGSRVWKGYLCKYFWAINYIISGSK